MDFLLLKGFGYYCIIIQSIEFGCNQFHKKIFLPNKYLFWAVLPFGLSIGVFCRYKTLVSRFFNAHFSNSYNWSYFFCNCLGFS